MTEDKASDDTQADLSSTDGSESPSPAPAQTLARYTSTYSSWGLKRNSKGEWVRHSDAVRVIAEKDVRIQGWRNASRSTFEALCAMRDSINEHVPLPSLESDLIEGPENSVFCSVVAEAVASHVAALEAENKALREALEEIAKQKKTSELDTEYEVEHADFEGGYDSCIDRAREALAQDVGE